MKLVIDIFFYIMVSAILSWFFYYWRRRDILGGYVGGLIVGLFGSIIGTFLLGNFLQTTVDILQKGLKISNVNLLASFIGGYTALYIFNKINHDKERRDH